MGFSRRNKVNIFSKGGVDFQSEEHYLDVKKLDSFRSPLFNEKLDYRVKRLMIHCNIRATLCESFCDVITRVR